jgi:transcriptional regulator with XRE-family HTH domain
MTQATELNQAIRKLRQHFGDTQQSWASRLGLSIASVVRYELSGPPDAQILVRLADLAHKEKLKDVAEVLNTAVAQRVGALTWGKAQDAGVNVTLARGEIIRALNAGEMTEEARKRLERALSELKGAEKILMAMADQLQAEVESSQE